RLTDQHLSEAEKLMSDYPEIFSVDDRRTWRQDLLRILLKEVPERHVFIALSGKNVAGAILFSEDVESHNHYWEINWIVVNHEFQRKGIGSVLLKKAFNEMREKLGERVYVKTSAAHYNEDTRAFYKKMGFEELTSLPHYYADKEKNTAENAIVFYQKLT